MGDEFGTHGDGTLLTGLAFGEDWCFWLGQVSRDNVVDIDTFGRGSFGAVLEVERCFGG